ncbi:hypothetical protein TCAL_04298 [Tigriopus californicus]|uniref:Peroxiredoxin-5 n=1 Tax=Tigriopus californicus TaxID=6832 RepID=A0A553NCZ1_TIGCA|nr:peroxiredoxin-5, mitochondrial-like [Tigriopus californicus]TRY63311.1 hypothetical protein TCAL_04298 [Tigriopus californicus]|eukprot:TCALIF_04298-PA protein Name:"Similar to PRDX5 Peroxiredoxin-5, mitochondrial (Homo sapiens)" AED:0.05 eAED:0.05 QI:220/1/1/1/1/1/4/99/191
MISAGHTVVFSRKLVASVLRPALLTQRSFQTSVMAPVKVGDAVPSVELYEGAPDKKVDLAELTKSGKSIIFGVPGAFTPGCSKTHLPGFVAKADELKGKGIKEIICVAVNDPFVMGAWGENQKADGKVRMLADTHGKLAQALDLEVDLAAVLGTKRMKRFSMVVEDGKVTEANIEPDGTGMTCSLAEKISV